MGEIADMILDGMLCEWCGVYIGEGVGYTRKCPGCKAEANEGDVEYDPIWDEPEKI